MSDIEWRPIKDFPDYEISSYGQIMRVVARGGAKVGSILKARPHGEGYLRVGLSQPGAKGQKMFSVHYLVARTFIGERPRGYHINHKDGIKTNNHYLNLHYITPSENTQHAYDTGLAKRGEKSVLAKLTRKDVIKMRELYATGEFTFAELGEKYNVDTSTVARIIKRESWKHL